MPIDWPLSFLPSEQAFSEAAEIHCLPAAVLVGLLIEFLAARLTKVYRLRRGPSPQPGDVSRARRLTLRQPTDCPHRGPDRLELVVTVDRVHVCA